ncbi:cytochrome b [Paraburkholderia megapolitana]|uniref:cytochrome b n=1 Tax=Paraburkholderia megapolitana TaxID=420953 RepID=UPI0038BAF088
MIKIRHISEVGVLERKRYEQTDAGTRSIFACLLVFPIIAVVDYIGGGFMTQLRYPGGARFFHWLMAAIIVVVWCIGFGSSHLRGDAPRGGAALLVHKAIASTVLFLVLARLAYRWRHRHANPGLPETISRPMLMVAKVVHILLYAGVMIATPLSGWIWSSVAGHPVPLLGVVDLPPIAPVNQANYDLWMWIHRALAWSAGVMIALHVLAALKHHFFDHDDVLVRMLPWRSRSKTRSSVRSTRDLA